jgi:aminopeptidase N
MRILFTTLFSLFFSLILVAQGDAIESNDFTSPLLCLGHPIQPPKAIIIDYDIVHYDFDLQIERNTRDIVGNVTISAKAVKDNFDSFEFQLHDNYKIDSMVLGGQKIVLMSSGKNQRMAFFATPIPKNQLFKVKIYYRGKAPLSTNNWGNGIVQKKDSKYGAEVIYSLSVPYHALEWFPCKQVLSDLVDSVSMKITTDIDNTVISNGLLTSDLTLPNNKHAVTWKTHYPINFYLISFAVGKYIPYHFDVSLPGKSTKMPVMNYLYNQASLTKQKPTLDLLGGFLTNYSNLFGLYPFHEEKFGTVVVPLSGGMEHQTIVNLATDYDKFLAAHEMAHQWWGDNVNAKSYHDVWLNEGWATYCEYLTAEKLFPSEARGILDNFHSSAVGQIEGRTYIADTTDFSTIYNYANVYMKGAAIIHTLRYEIGNDSLFFRALNIYQTTFAHKSVEVADMKALLEKETGKDLTLYFNQWYYGFGYPKFTITWFNNNNKLIIKSLQSTSSAKTPLFKTNVDYLIKRDNKVDTIITLYQSKNEQTYLIEGLTNVKSISLDPNNVIVNKVNSIKQDANLIAIKNMIPENLIQVYPIPARDMITIETQLNETWTLELYNEKGSLVHKSYGSDHVKSIPVHDFPQGAYFIKISTENTKAWSRAITIIH